LSDEKKAYIRLKLHDLTIIDQFICYSECGLEAEPAHRVLINAKGEYDSRSDKLEINGQEIDLDRIQISAVPTKEDCLKSHARRGYISIGMIDHVFSPFVELLRKNTQTGEIVMALDAQQHPEVSDAVRLSFDGMDMTRSAGAAVKEQTQQDRLISRLADHMRRSERFLFAIAVITGLIFVHVLFR
jgi:hypothetical protein